MRGHAKAKSRKGRLAGEATSHVEVLSAFCNCRDRARSFSASEQSRSSRTKEK
jgi:hypothetical protein